MPAATSLAIAGLAVSIIGAAGSAATSYMASKEAKKQAKEEKKRQELEQRRERLKTIREGRIKRAQTLNTGAQIGATGSSGLSGGLSSTSSQVGTNLGYSTQVEGINDNIYKSSKRIASLQQLGSISSGIGSIGGAVFGNAGAISNAFSSPTPSLASTPSGNKYAGRPF